MVELKPETPLSLYPQSDQDVVLPGLEYECLKFFYTQTIEDGWAFLIYLNICHENKCDMVRWSGYGASERLYFVHLSGYKVQDLEAIHSLCQNNLEKKKATQWGTIKHIPCLKEQNLISLNLC